MYECQLCQQKMCTFLVIEIRLDFIFFKVSKKNKFLFKIISAKQYSHAFSVERQQQ